MMDKAGLEEALQPAAGLEEVAAIVADLQAGRVAEAARRVEGLLRPGSGYERKVMRLGHEILDQAGGRPFCRLVAFLEPEAFDVALLLGRWPSLIESALPSLTDAKEDRETILKIAEQAVRWTVPQEYGQQVWRIVSPLLSAEEAEGVLLRRGVPPVPEVLSVGELERALDSSYGRLPGPVILREHPDLYVVGDHDVFYPLVKELQQQGRLPGTGLIVVNWDMNQHDDGAAADLIGKFQSELRETGAEPEFRELARAGGQGGWEIRRRWLALWDFLMGLALDGSASHLIHVVPEDSPTGEEHADLPTGRVTLHRVTPGQLPGLLGELKPEGRLVEMLDLDHFLEGPSQEEAVKQFGRAQQEIEQGGRRPSFRVVALSSPYSVSASAVLPLLKDVLAALPTTSAGLEEWTEERVNDYLGELGQLRHEIRRFSGVIGLIRDVFVPQFFSELSMNEDYERYVQAYNALERTMSRWVSPPRREEGTRRVLTPAEVGRHLTEQSREAVRKAEEVIRLHEAVCDLIDRTPVTALPEGDRPFWTRDSFSFGNTLLVRVIRGFSNAGGHFDAWGVPARMDTALLLRDYHRFVEPSVMAQRELSIQYEEEEDLPEIWADENNLFLAMDNLVRNTARVARDQGLEAIPLTIRVHREEEGVAVVIEDKGPGMPPEMLESIRRGERTTTQKVREGHGIGLSVVRSVVHAAMGEMEVESSQREEDHGTTVTLRFPAADRVVERAAERFRVERRPDFSIENIGFLLEGEGVAFAPLLAVLESRGVFLDIRFAGIVETRREKDRLLGVFSALPGVREMLDQRLVVVEEQSGESRDDRYLRAVIVAESWLGGLQIQRVDRRERGWVEQLNAMLATVGYRLPEDPSVQQAANAILSFV